MADKVEKKKTTIDYTNIADDLDDLRDSPEWRELTPAQKLKILVEQKVQEELAKRALDAQSSSSQSDAS